VREPIEARRTPSPVAQNPRRWTLSEDEQMSELQRPNRWKSFGIRQERIASLTTIGPFDGGMQRSVASDG
jgi:hypothetical protein